MTIRNNNSTSNKQTQPSTRKPRRKTAGSYLLDLLQKGEGTDPFGRRFIPDNWPLSFYLAEKPDSKELLEFTLQAPSADQKQLMVYTHGDYVLDATTGKIEATFEIAAGVTQTVSLSPGGSQLIVTTTKEGKLRQLLNADEAPLQKIAVYDSGLVITEVFDSEGQGELTTLQIQYPDASVVSLAKADTANPLYTGQRTNAHGHFIEQGLWNPSFELIQYEDAQGNATRAEMYVHGKEENKPLPKLTEGTYDRDRAVFTSADPVFPGMYRVVWIGQGRTETWLANGQKTWEDAVNSNAYAVVRPLRKGQSFCEAEVNNEDGTGARLYADNSIECWNSSELFDKEQLPEQLVSLMMANAAVDRRDVAEFYRQYRTRSADMLYVVAKLKQFNSAKRLTSEQKQALIATGLHEIAFPRDIYQGLCGSCNVTTVQRELTVKHIKRLLANMVSAVTKGYVTGKSGKRYKINVDNAIIAEASGRPIFCRLFQSIALQVVGHKRGLIFRTTPDGTGALLKPASSDLDFGGALASRRTAQQVFPLQSVEPFDGLDTQLITWVLTELSGVEYGILFLKSIEELEAQLAKSGVVILVVDGSRPPINPNGPFSDDPLEPNHVISVIDIVLLPNGKILVLFENEWGDGFDHSTLETGVDAEDFLANCMMPYGQMEEEGAPKEGLYMEAIVRQIGSARKRPCTQRKAS